MKKLLWLLAFLLGAVVIAAILLAPLAFAQETGGDLNSKPKRVVIINQVRGNECCDAGSLDKLQQQVRVLREQNLPATFVIRYDALTNPDYQQFLHSLDSDQFELGVFLEVTPSLAAAADVDYQGDENNWYQAQHAYPIGYQPEDRKALIDAVVTQFEQVFNFNPAISTAWIIDTESINYLRAEHDITVHQITREQWGTDSYTLYGGPPHYPYVARENWAFLPAGTLDATASGTLMLRQTGADPLYNYGDQSNAFTTQPNDYTTDGKDFSYFTTLFDNFMHQSGQPYGFVLLGLENSMSAAMQAEYQRQLEYVAAQRSQDEELEVVTATAFNQEFRTQWQDNRVRVISRQAANTAAYWITTPQYRVRLHQQGERLVISDFRLYGDDLFDPYNSRPAENLAYWITPFLFDSSRFYQAQVTPTTWKTRMINGVKSILLPEYRYMNKQFPQLRNERQIVPAGIYLPTVQDQIKVKWTAADTLELQYSGDSGLVTLQFTPAQISLQGAAVGDQYSIVLPETLPFVTETPTEAGQEVSWQNEMGERQFALQVQCQVADRCTFIPKVAEDFNASQFYAAHYPYMQPEITTNYLPAETVSYAHNPVALAGVNPVRLVVIPRDKFGYPTALDSELRVAVEPPVDEVIVNRQQGDKGTIFVDLHGAEPGGHQAVVAGDNKEYLWTSISYVPNCRENPSKCVINPINGWRYLQFYLRGKLRNM